MTTRPPESPTARLPQPDSCSRTSRITNANLTGSGRAHVPFPEGGRGRAAQRFGEGSEPPLRELNEVLAA